MRPEIRVSSVTNTLIITQHELAYVVGLSRQRFNVVLKALKTESKITLEYGGLRMLDMANLTN